MNSTHHTRTGKIGRLEIRAHAAIKEQPKQSTCRAWIAKFEGRWHWSSPSNLQLPNPFRN